MRRRRRCLACDKRFTTYERVELQLPLVVKKNGSRVDYDRDKLSGSMTLALRKRPVTTESVDAAIDRIEERLVHARRARSGVRPHRRTGDARAEEARQGRLHPLRLGLSQLRGSRRVLRRHPRGEEARADTCDAKAHVSFSAADHEFMARALRLAERGSIRTTPNPRVGCVLVKDGTGRRRGLAREGRRAARRGRCACARPAPRRAAPPPTSHLEPCSHFGRTPPCADALIDAGVTRVVAAMEDPNPRVAGEGMAKLRAAGVDATVGLMSAEATELNIGFVSRMSRGRPWLRLKVAASLDGKTALNNGKSQWITGADARRDAHAWRARSCAILTGIGTVRDDDPSLTVREVP